MLFTQIGIKEQRKGCQKETMGNSRIGRGPSLTHSHTRTRVHTSTHTHQMPGAQGSGTFALVELMQ